MYIHKDEEVWRVAPGCDGLYEVSSHGRVRRISNGGKSRKIYGYVLTPGMSSKGYAKVVLTLRKRVKCGIVHRLVALAFLGPRPKGCETNHKDGDKWHNHYSNLEYVTHLQNMQHASRNGLYRTGEKHYSARLTEAQVREIRANYVPFKRGGGARVLARRYGVATPTMSAVLSGHTWVGVK